MYYRLCNKRSQKRVHQQVRKENIRKAFYVRVRSLKTTLILQVSWTCTKRHIHVTRGKLQMYCCFVTFNYEPLELWLHTKKGDGVAEDQRKQSVSMIPSENIVSSTVKNKNGYGRSMTTKWALRFAKRFANISPQWTNPGCPLFGDTSNFHVDPLKSHQFLWEQEACGMRAQQESKERAITDLRDTPIAKALQKVDEHQKKRLCYLFTQLISLPKKRNQFSDFECICELPLSMRVRLKMDSIWVRTRGGTPI